MHEEEPPELVCPAFTFTTGQKSISFCEHFALSLNILLCPSTHIPSGSLYARILTLCPFIASIRNAKCLILLYICYVSIRRKLTLTAEDISDGLRLASWQTLRYKARGQSECYGYFGVSLCLL